MLPKAQLEALTTCRVKAHQGLIEQPEATSPAAEAFVSS